MSEEHEIERAVSREEAVATMQAVVDGVASGTLRFESTDGDSIDVDVPDVVDVEIELELEDEEAGAEVEVELEWPVEEPAAEAGASTGRVDDVPHERAGNDGPEEETDETLGEPADETFSEQVDGAPGERGDEVSEARVDEAPPEGTEADREASVTEATGVAPLGPAEPTESLARFEVYRDRADEWRWRLVHHNGNVIADGGEGYTSKQSALKGLRSVMRNAPEATVEDESTR